VEHYVLLLISYLK